MKIEQMSKIEKKVFVRAPRARVWRAIANAEEFAEWFNVKIEGTFHPGARIRITSRYPGHETPFHIEIDRMEPEHLFSWRWQVAGASDSGSEEPHTHVVFKLTDVEGGTMVTVIESGFDNISLPRRAKAFEGNTEGWEIQTEAIRKYVEEAA